ncbi:MltA-interacting protein MipA [Bacteriovorax sp. BSW11_IV]|uniref:MipA/OmpV family protein n=1 Tax=Bacteriovorax sp. BSW11_IV TaxID=1353529 RepID=UPI000389EC16|nr:MipA/OmpV family protein [Bacteriovorax sp. BSW11_IV]EQC47829.1 MltA-interacting protein MipA [Bacteriovorax sp. BSW11_IV]
MRKFVFSFCLLFLAMAQTMALELMSFDHPVKGRRFIVEKKGDECAFTKNSNNIEIKVVDNSGDVRNIDLFEKIYFSVSSNISEDNFAEIVFSGMKEASFFITFAKQKDGHCLIEKQVFIDGKMIDFDKIDINYFFNLYFPTLRNISFIKNKKVVKTFESFEVQSYFPFYEFSIGLGVNVHTNIRPKEMRRFNKAKTVVEPLPVFLFRYGPLFLSKDGAGVLLVPFEKFAVLATFLLEGEPYKSDLTFERKRSIYFGPLIKSGPLEILYYRDVRDVSYGEVFKVTLAPEFHIRGGYSLSFRLFYQYWDQKYTDYYFGVPKDNGNGLSFYKPNEAHNYGLSVRTAKKFRDYELGLELGQKFYSNEVYDSPIVIKKSEFRFMLGVMYRLL